MTNNPQTIVHHLREDFLKARKNRDQLTSTTLQTALSAIDNAGAVPINSNVTATEVPRRELTAQDINEILEREILELQHAIRELGTTATPYADELRAKIKILEKYLV
jgi:uncharacterized protein